MTDFRMLVSPGPELVQLTAYQWLQLAQALGLDLRALLSAKVEVKAVGDFVVLLLGADPLLVLSRQEWQDKLTAWVPVMMPLSKE